ncbi:MAG TPA: N-acetylglucosamine-6-phosphate deacetylase [Candidatus Dormibacteraeota bacterium]|jgi:N-acetylglucosamine-6-phosphate deacetylase|nr:N-acetylglucosamine-6-phosphate deacetylase [Candidatus Dormibacteraeota bacterium]
MIVLCADRLYSPQEEIREPLLFIEDGLISAVSTRAQKEIPKNATVVDLTDNEAILAPGFVDIHMHGGAGLDVMRAATSELPHLNKFLTTHGVTGYFPTTVAAPLDQTCGALERLADAIEAVQDSHPGNGNAVEAHPLGIHLEGPFLSHLRRGVHPPEYLITPTLEIFDRLWQAARGHVRMMTIAPELPGALEVIAEAARRKVLVSIGHSDAVLDVARAGVKAGAHHATHTFNAMRPLDHRDPGILAEVLTDKHITADIIVDGIHVAPEVVQLFLQAKGLDRAVLITDAMAATGMPDGTYQLGPIQVEVKDGKCTAGGKLAGSVLTMDRAVRNVAKFAGWSLQHAVRAATLNPARAAGLAQHGTLVPGAEANLVVLSPGGEVRKTIVRGRGF